MWYNYDEMNRLIEVRSGGQEGGVLARYIYDANGNRISQTYPQNGVETTYAYNKANLVTALVNKKGADVLSEFSYRYTQDGNQISKTGPDGTTEYSYDRLGRLIQESAAGWHTISYSFDAFANRSRMEVSGQDGNYVTDYVYDRNNRLVTETKTEDGRTEIFRYSYDANGNQIQRERQKARARTEEAGRIGFVRAASAVGRAVTLDSRAYNGFNQLTRVYRDGMVTEFAYQPDNLRHSKRSYDGGKAFRPMPTVHYWDGQNIVLEANSNDYVKAAYLRGITLIAQLIGDSVMHYLHNAHGDVVQRIDAQGNGAPTYTYDAFGNQKDANPADPNPFRYCGEYFDRETEEVYLRNRYYDSRTGRFGQEDKARSGLNWYTYCGNDPVHYADPSGLRAFYVGPSLDAGSGPPPKPKQVTKPQTSTPKTSTQGNPIFNSRPGALPSYAIPESVPLADVNYALNRSVAGFGPGIMIHRQGNDPAANLRVGITTVGKTGCGMVAAYNAVQLMGDYQHPADIIYALDKRGGLRALGLIGYNARAITSYLNELGYDATYRISKPASYDALIMDSNVMILQYYWLRTAKSIFEPGGHYVTIVYDPAGDPERPFAIYNSGGRTEEASRVESIDAWIEGQGHLLSYITIPEAPRSSGGGR